MIGSGVQTFHHRFRVRGNSLLVLISLGLVRTRRHQMKSNFCPVVDPGFPRGGGANSPGGAPTYDFAKNPKNCMKLKEFWPPGEGARPKFYYVDPPLHCRHQSVPQKLMYVFLVVRRPSLSDDKKPIYTILWSRLMTTKKSRRRQMRMEPYIE